MRCYTDLSLLCSECTLKWQFIKKKNQDWIWSKKSNYFILSKECSFCFRFKLYNFSFQIKSFDPFVYVFETVFLHVKLLNWQNKCSMQSNAFCLNNLIKWVFKTEGKHFLYCDISIINYFKNKYTKIISFLYYSINPIWRRSCSPWRLCPAPPPPQAPRSRQQQQFPSAGWVWRHWRCRRTPCRSPHPRGNNYSCRGKEMVKSRGHVTRTGQSAVSQPYRAPSVSVVTCCTSQWKHKSSRHIQLSYDHTLRVLLVCTRTQPTQYYLLMVDEQIQIKRQTMGWQENGSWWMWRECVCCGIFSCSS